MANRRTTIKRILRRNEIAPDSVIAAADFFTTEVWTARGLVTHYTVFVIDLANRAVGVVGTTTSPGLVCGVNSDGDIGTLSSVAAPDAGTAGQDLMEQVDFLEDGVVAWLPAIDEFLAKGNVPIPDRIDSAASIFVRHVITDIKNDTKEFYILKPWFKAIYTIVRRWYHDKYGIDTTQRRSKVFMGVFLYAGVPFELRVPKHINRVEKEGETFWFVFPSEVQVDEDPFSFIVSPPKLSALTTVELDAVRCDITRVANHLRVISVDLATADHLDANAEAMARSVLLHLRTAAIHLLDTDAARHGLGLACWESHQAAEKALKVLSRQKTGNHTRTHELPALWNDLRSHVELDERLLGRLPSGKIVVKMRTGENTVGLADAFDIYDDALVLVAHCANRLSRKVIMRNTAFLLRKLPFVE